MRPQLTLLGAVLACLFLTMCSKDEGTPPKKPTLPQSAGQPGGRKAGRPANADEDRPRAKAAADENRPRAKAAADENRPRAKADPAASQAVVELDLVGRYVGSLRRSGEDMLIEVTLEKGPNGALRGTAEAPALAVHDAAIAPNRNGNSLRFDLGSAGRVQLDAAGGGNSLVGSFATAGSPNAPRHDAELRRLPEGAAGPVTSTWRGTVAMGARGDVNMSFTLSVLGDGLLGFVIAPQLARTTMILRTAKEQDGKITAVMPVGAALGALELTRGDDDGLSGILRMQGQEHAVALTRADE